MLNDEERTDEERTCATCGYWGVRGDTGDRRVCFEGLKRDLRFSNEACAAWTPPFVGVPMMGQGVRES
jgi:hypothetical protein